MAMVTAQAAGAIRLDPTVETVRRAAAGDQVAFARLVEACHRDMIRVAYVVAHDEQLAQDAVQAAWTTAWQKLGSLRDPHRVRPWLVAVAANEARQILRHEHRRPVAELRLDAPADPVAGMGEPIDRMDLGNALARLSDRDRTLLALRYVARLESPEIAPLLGMSASGVRGHLSRLLGRLRTELGND